MSICVSTTSFRRKQIHRTRRCQVYWRSSANKHNPDSTQPSWCADTHSGGRAKSVNELTIPNILTGNGLKSRGAFHIANALVGDSTLTWLDIGSAVTVGDEGVGKSALVKSLVGQSSPKQPEKARWSGWITKSGRNVSRKTVC